jgi:LacI family transcriptional regulator
VTFLGDEASSPDTHERWTALCAALRDAGVRPPTRPARCAFDEGAGHETAQRVLARRPLPDAVVCANDEIALGTLLAGEEAGLSVPGDVAVTGWDDVMAARYARPALTTVAQPMRALGERAARLLHDLIEGGDPSPHHDVLPTRLVIRDSCGTHPVEER